jgi:polysaccharide pyruvyl transferase WcaK-like protein
MHACIAALSQSIPAVGLAYSKKFHGVFESIELGENVADIYQCSDIDELISVVLVAFEKRNQTGKHLDDLMPKMKKEIMEMLEV